MHNEIGRYWFLFPIVSFIGNSYLRIRGNVLEIDSEIEKIMAIYMSFLYNANNTY